MHITFTFQIGFVSFVFFPSILSLLLLILRGSALQEPKIKNKKPTTNKQHYHPQIPTYMIPPNILPSLARIWGLAFFFNVNWPPVTVSPYTGSWLVNEATFPAVTLSQQLLCIDALEDREEQIQVRGRDGYQGHTRAIFSSDIWSRYSASYKCKMAEDNKDGCSITLTIWKVRKTGIWRQCLKKENKKITRKRSKKDDDICISLVRKWKISK